MKKTAGTVFALVIVFGGCTNSLNMGEINVGGEILRLPGARSSSIPHPGKIEAKYEWNNSIEYWDASELPDSFIFRCFDKRGKRTARDRAAWCIPVVEVVTVSLDKNYRPASPKDAAFIENTVYGPDHTFLEHNTSGPLPLPNSGNGASK